MEAMQAVGYRPKELVDEALGLVCQLMPLPKGAIFLLSFW